MVALLKPTAAEIDVPRLRVVDGGPAWSEVAEGCEGFGASESAVTAGRQANRAPLRLVDSPPREARFPGVPVAGPAVAVAVVFGLLFAVRLLQGGPPADSGADATIDPREPAQALVGPGDHQRLVMPGETLWSIAVELAPDADPRPIVEVLADRNGGSAIDAGQVLVIPAELVAVQSP